MHLKKVLDMPVKLISLNIEGDKHFARWIPEVQRQNPDVLCLQEVFAEDMDLISSSLDMVGYFIPMMNVTEGNSYKISPKGLWGIGYFTRLEHTSPQVHYYAGEGELRTFKKPGDSARVLVTAENTSLAGEKVCIGTTHFTWTPNGEASDEQRRDAAALLECLAEYPEVAFCGDFNAPRGKEIFSLFAENYTDNLPKEVTSTLDPTLHYKGSQLELAVDTLFTSSGYTARNVAVLTGVSDHYGIVAEISCTRAVN